MISGVSGVSSTAVRSAGDVHTGGCPCPLASILTPSDREALPNNGTGDTLDYVDSHPDAFGGMVHDDAERTDVVFVVEGKPASDPAVWAGSMEGPEDLEIRCVHHSEAELDVLAHKLLGAAPGLAADGTRIETISFDRASNSVLVTVRDPSLLDRLRILLTAGLGAPVTIFDGELGCVPENVPPGDSCGSWLKVLTP